MGRKSKQMLKKKLQKLKLFELLKKEASGEKLTKNLSEMLREVFRTIDTFSVARSMVLVRRAIHSNFGLQALAASKTDILTLAKSKMVDPLSKPFALKFEILAECKVSKARVGRMSLPHSVIDTPVFMPVGTQGTMKGILPEQLEEINCNILLGNTYHLGHRPGHELIKEAGGLHKFMNWGRSILTDSGGFQMVSLSKLSCVTEEGVEFSSPHTEESMLLTPEHSIHIQNDLGADIIMQLDDVVHSLTTGDRVREAMLRSIRWLDRCISAHNRPNHQNLFPIIQGGLDLELRKECLKAMIERDQPGYAIGGLSGGEDKDSFWPVISLCTDYLPRGKPRYAMGIGWALDLVVCSALGVDMFDCVYPTRIARFGTAITPSGLINLRSSTCAEQLIPIEEECPCTTCKRKYTRAYLYSCRHETVVCHLVSIHNLTYQMRLMENIRKSIEQQTFPEFVRQFVKILHSDGNVPMWAREALQSVNICV